MGNVAVAEELADNNELYQLNATEPGDGQGDGNEDVGTEETPHPVEPEDMPHVEPEDMPHVEPDDMPHVEPDDMPH